jgi:ribonuclease Z
MAAVDEDIWPLPSVTKKLAANPADRIGFSDFVTSGRVVFEDVIKFYYDQTNQMFGTDFEPPK